MNHTKRKEILGFIGWMFIVFIAASIGAAASINAGSFYSQLVRPEWAPPAWVFGPAWTILYTLMGISAWLIWRSVNFRTNHPALILFFLQLALNALWSWLFFSWHLGTLAFVDIVLLLVLIAVMLFWFWRIKPLAGVLIVPYLLWVGFASLLCYTIWQLNPQALA